MPNLKRLWKQSSSSSSLVTHHHPPSSFFSCLESISIGCMESLQQIPALHGLHHLKYIRFFDLPTFQSLPPLHELPSLESLTLEELKSVEYIQDWEECYDYSGNCCITSCSPDSNSKSPAKASSPLFFPSLKLLFLINMPNVERWWKQSSSSSSSLVTHHHPPSHDDDDDVPLPPPHFPILSCLSICQCPNLMSVPLFPYVEHLEMKFCSNKILKQQEEYYNSQNNDTTSLSSSTPFSKLVELIVNPVVEGVPEELIKHFTSLKTIQITSTDYSEIFTWYSGRTPPILRGTQEGLKITGKVMILPDWIKKFTSLQQLRVWDCPKLESLPHWLSQLTSLQKLSIERCPKLEERCSRVNEGADWPNIAHIPFIKINFETIQDISIL